MYLWLVMSSVKKLWLVYICIFLFFCIWIICEFFNWFLTLVNIFCSLEIFVVVFWSLVVKEFMVLVWFVLVVVSFFRRLFNFDVLVFFVFRICVVVLRFFCNVLFLVWDLCSFLFILVRRFDNVLFVFFCLKKFNKKYIKLYLVYKVILIGNIMYSKGMFF